MTRRRRQGWGGRQGGVGKEGVLERRRQQGDMGEEEELERKRHLCDRAVATTAGLEVGV